ncbi:Crp/Fnr family transcriptional regulator [Mycobacterium sp. ITM-2016-00318]|uniref:Crp/Fnr family transcriptional regulator n=1 Tax=Mycobacterium sp. ITM-2016-00318 TaxID=2099693 RepID=UPI000CF9B990|nr:Crp/Fnr family transcriptional regulator [Mycobacterium sp. ITM-2016-00318]WNG92800.1 Crp/Fnr family transcriptional regulator [Mycobacterium sp. ITM-2016-00318]
MDRTVADAALFRALEPSVVATLTSRLPTVDFAAGDVIYARGDLDAQLYILVDGKVKLGRCAEDGRENILSVLAPPDIFGELSILDPGPQPWNATAITEVHAATVDGDRLERWIDQYPPLASRLLRLMAGQLRQTTDAMADLSFIDAPARVAKQLLGLAQRFGIPEDGSTRVTHDLTQEELAQLVGATRETVNKALSDFRNRGWIRVDGKSVLISNSERLAHRAH